MFRVRPTRRVSTPWLLSANFQIRHTRSQILYKLYRRAAVNRALFFFPLHNGRGVQCRVRNKVGESANCRLFHVSNSLSSSQKRKTTTISVEVKKSQHKYIIGPKGNTLQEILEATGVSVEMPPLDSSSETIILRGEPDKLGPALTQVYAKVRGRNWHNRDMLRADQG